MNSKTVKAIGVIIIVAQALALISTHMEMDSYTLNYLVQSAGMNMFTYVITTIAEILVKAVPFLALGSILEHQETNSEKNRETVTILRSIEKKMD
ncbi:MAG: hypothetical protein IKK32_04380 [Oscillospiraceae bacterium]|nr:hypothetical protein [Oscillospiraceae bacterium]